MRKYEKNGIISLTIDEIHSGIKSRTKEERKTKRRRLQDDETTKKNTAGTKTQGVPTNSQKRSHMRDNIPRN